MKLALTKCTQPRSETIFNRSRLREREVEVCSTPLQPIVIHGLHTYNNLVHHMHQPVSLNQSISIACQPCKDRVYAQCISLEYIALQRRSI